MSNQFVGELRLVGFNFAPVGWALAQGQLLPLSQNTALFALFGTLYGGDGKSNFGLPNLQGALALGFGQGPGLSLYDQGETGGEQTVTLLTTETPNHQHSAIGVNGLQDSLSAGNNSLADSAPNLVYSSNTTLVGMNEHSLSVFGQGNPHNNIMPTLCLNWIVALQGIFPSRG